MHLKDDPPYTTERNSMEGEYDQLVASPEEEIEEDDVSQSGDVGGAGLVGGAGGDGKEKDKGKGKDKDKEKKPHATRRRVVQSCSECRRRCVSDLWVYRRTRC
jgi:hypothetical protein